MVVATNLQLDQRINGLISQLDQRFEGQEEALKTAMRASQEALTTAMTASNAANDARFTGQERAVQLAIDAADLRHEQRFQAQEKLAEVRIIARVEALAQENDSMSRRFDSNREASNALTAAAEKRYDERFRQHEIEKQAALDSLAQRIEILAGVTTARADKDYTVIEKTISEGNHVLDERLHSLIHALDEKLTQTVSSAALARDKYDIAIEKRFDSVNEFRAQLTDQTATFMPRAEMEARLASIAEKVQVNADRVNGITATGLGRKESQASMYALVGLLATILAIAGMILAFKTP
jgi:hypothetical protein